MKTLNIAFRNIFRNRRRSLMTILAISVSAISVVLFGGYVFAIIYGLQTGIVQNTGHLHIYQAGYFAFGAGNPSAYGISHHEDIIKMIQEDPQLKSRIVIATPRLGIYGIAGNFAEDVSKTFFGLGLIPSDYQKMKEWNAYQLKLPKYATSGLADQDTEGGVIGTGMARMLHLCDALKVAKAGCQDKPREKPVEKTTVTEDFTALTELDNKPTTEADKRPKLDLLAATTRGAPNVVSLYLNKAENQGLKEIDDNFVAMHLLLAQKLLYGKGEKKVTGIVLQLKYTDDVTFVKERLIELFSEKNLAFEVKDFGELRPMYGQIISLFVAIFTFVSLIMGVIVLFTIINTMSMSVMERVNEIGTVRALGMRQSGIVWQFLLEGCVLGMFGATIGLIIAAIIGIALNSSGIMWMPPNNVEPVFLTVELFQNWFFLPACWLLLVLLATLSSLLPARKAGKMVVVDALRHV